MKEAVNPLMPPCEIELLKRIVIEQQVTIEQLHHQLEKLQRLLFGQKSEKRKTDKEDQSDDSSTPENKVLGLSISPQGKNGRKRLPEELPRLKVEHDLAEEEKTCSNCQSALHRMGEEITEQLDFVPGKVHVKQHIRYKYACRCCQSVVVTSPLTEQPTAKGLAGSGLLAAVLIDKYEDALPLYRQEQRWRRAGYEITRSTLCDWVSQCAERLKPIVEAMKKAFLLTSPKIHSDDTPVPVLAKGKTHPGRMWVYAGGNERSPPCVIYQYSQTRKQEIPFKFLETYEGFLQADAYAGYDKCYQSGKIIEVACWAHARRKFVDVAQSVKTPTLADTALDYIGQLYGIEKTARNMTDKQRYYYRRYHAKPLLKIIYRWLKKYQAIALPKSPLGQAIQYNLNHWKAFNNYLRHGCLDIDNNAAERAIKPLVIGRKNYLFAGSHQGAENAAVIYSLIQTCKSLGINTFDYLKDVLEKLPSTLMKNIADLFPQHWKPNKI